MDLGLQFIYDGLTEQIRELTDSFERGDITLEEWQDQMAEKITAYQAAAYMVGHKMDTLDPYGEMFVKRAADQQKQYLGGFARLIGNTLAAALIYSMEGDLEKSQMPRWGAWKSRAAMYAGSVIQPYWKGYADSFAPEKPETVGEISPGVRQVMRINPEEGNPYSLPLPALPADGTSQCLSHCRCGWEIQPVDAKKGDFDCYWRIDTKSPKPESCQTCIERARRWNPLVVRDWQIVMPPVWKEVEAAAELPDTIHGDALGELREMILVRMKGGKGSGFIGHSGRLGKTGGSVSRRDALVMSTPKTRGLAVSESYDEMMSNVRLIHRFDGGIPYMISPDGKLYTTESQANDHFDVIAGIAYKDPGSLGISLGLARQLVGYNADPEDNKHSDSIGKTMESAKKLGWIRCRVSSGNRKTISIESNRIDNATLEKLQDYMRAGKFGSDLRERVIYWEGQDANGDSQWLSRVSYADFASARRLISNPGRYDSSEGGSLRLKGGPGSGNFSHAGRPGKVGGSAPSSGGLSAGVSTATDTPEFKRWFGDSRVVGENEKPLVVYHGTLADFNAFRQNEESNMPDRKLGFHFAEDPDISSRFALGVYGPKTGWGHYQYSGGNVMPVYLKVENPRIIKPEQGRFDQYLIAKDMVDLTFSEDKDLFVDWFVDRNNGFQTREKGEAIYDKLIKGEEASTAEFGEPGYDKASFEKWNPGATYGIASYVMNAGLGYKFQMGARGAEMVQRYKKALRARGYDGILYENTAPMETQDVTMTFEAQEYWQHAPEMKFSASSNRRTWIVFDSNQVKSAFNEGSFDPTNPNILKEYDVAEFKETRTTAIVAFDAQNVDLGDISVPGQKVDEHHITLLFLGDIDNLDRQDCEERLAEFAKAHGPIEGSFGGYAVFRGDDIDGSPVVLLYDSPELPAFREALVEVFGDCPGVKDAKHGFIPHMTLAYTHDTDIRIPADGSRIEKRFDRVCLWWGGEHTDFPLGEAVSEKGGEGSGNFGHQGRPGKVGGSGVGYGAEITPQHYYLASAQGKYAAVSFGRYQTEEEAHTAARAGADKMSAERGGGFKPKVEKRTILERGIRVRAFHGSNKLVDTLTIGNPAPRMSGGELTGRERSDTTSEAIFFSKTRFGANFFAKNRAENLGGSPHIYDAEIVMKKPLDMTRADDSVLKILRECGFDLGGYMSSSDNYSWDNIEMFRIDDLWQALDDREVVKNLKDRGYDGAILIEPAIPENKRERYRRDVGQSSNISYAVFSPEQVRIISKKDSEVSDKERIKSFILVRLNKRVKELL